MKNISKTTKEKDMKNMEQQAIYNSRRKRSIQDVPMALYTLEDLKEGVFIIRDRNDYVRKIYNHTPSDSEIKSVLGYQEGADMSLMDGSWGWEGPWNWCQCSNPDCLVQSYNERQPLGREATCPFQK